MGLLCNRLSFLLFWAKVKIVQNGTQFQRHRSVIDFWTAWGIFANWADNFDPLAQLKTLTLENDRWPGREI